VVIYLLKKKEDGLLEMDFPQGYCKKIELDEETQMNLARTCGINTKDILGTHHDDKSGKLIVELNSLDNFINAKVEAASLVQINFPVNVRGVSLTSCNLPNSKQYNNCDFASRYFSPWNGIPEDPVNGSSHTILGTFYQQKLNKNSFLAYMASERTGYLYITVKDHGRVCICGYAVTTLVGTIHT